MIEIEKVAAVEQALGVTVISMHQPEEGAWQMVCELGSQAEVEACAPNYVALADATALGVAITAPGNSTDFVSRFFIPQLGINEDPVTGSAHCQLTPHWAARLGKNELTAQQVSPVAVILNASSKVIACNSRELQAVCRGSVTPALG